ncbi:MAG TPA: hypothetical protein VH306_02570 [Gaiellaceae bacterium]
MHGYGNGRRAAALAFGVAFFFLVAGRAGAVARPSALAPADGATVSSLPAFTWKAVSGVDHYQFEVATDSAFNSPIRVDGRDYVTTRNTRATLKKSVPNGTLYWHVRGVTVAGATSAWSPTRSVKKEWLTAPDLVSPVDNASLSFPGEPLELVWNPVPRAAHYRITLATDPALGSAIVDDQLTAATVITPSSVLPRGRYYWAVTPVDAQGNRGKRSAVASFTYSWPATVAPTIEDLLPDVDEVFDPQFSWSLVPGAARYEVEVNPSSDFAAGSKVCCSPATIGSALAPKTLFENNTYYWRVRAIDAAGNAGPWTEGDPFQKTFDSPPDTPLPTVANLHMRDNVDDPGTDLDSGATGYQTDVPVVEWDPVPGASSYLVEVAPFGVSDCNWSSPTSHWVVKSATTAWTPLGTDWNQTKPYQSSHTVASETPKIEVGQKYCVRVRARTDRTSGNAEILGLETVLDDGSGSGFAFQFTGEYPTSTTCHDDDPSYPGADDYLEPQRGVLTGSAPLFTWNADPNAWSYFVIVSKDESFSTIVDYAFVRFPAYAPRTNTSPVTYTDELTSYYWAVLPSACANGNRARGTPTVANYADFEKRSMPPTLLAPIDDAFVSSQPIFSWTPVQGARRYRIEVSQDPSFSTLLGSSGGVTTNSTSYTSETTYPADTVLYWRVRAEDENLVGLTWSDVGTFRRVLQAPVPSADNPTAGSTIPAWTWDPITGAVSYDVQVDLPDGTHRSFSDFRSAAFAASRMTGVGIFTWQVRANYPAATTSGAPTHGPWSVSKAFTRTIPEPTGLVTQASAGNVLLSWDPRIAVQRYRAQLSSTTDFSSLIESVTTDETSYAPGLMLPAYKNGGDIWWRVAAVDEDGNVGAFTAPIKFTQPRGMTLTVFGTPMLKKRITITIRVYDAKHNPVGAALVHGAGAGVSTAKKRTKADGSVTFSVRATRRAKILFTATKSGFRTGQASVTVR